jgi:hypothetical protein
MQPQLFRIPAFRAGLVVQLLFGLGVQGFFLILALWIQAGIGFSPLRAGLTAPARSPGPASPPSTPARKTRTASRRAPGLRSGGGPTVPPTPPARHPQSCPSPPPGPVDIR